MPATIDDAATLGEIEAAFEQSGVWRSGDGGADRSNRQIEPGVRACAFFDTAVPQSSPAFDQQIIQDAFRRPGHFRTLPHAGRAPATPDELSGSACGRHPASAPCKPSQADTSVSAWTAPSRCRPKTPNTISGTAGPNSQNGHTARYKPGLTDEATCQSNRVLG